MRSVRSVLVGLGIAFIAYFALRALWWVGAPTPPNSLALAALTLFLATALLCLLWTAPTATVAAATEEDAEAGSGGGPLHPWACALALATAAILPTAMAFAVGPDARLRPYYAWILGGVGAIMTIVMSRRRPWIAWIGMIILTVGVVAWMGPAEPWGLGLIGSYIWVVVAQLMVLSLDRAARDTRRLTVLQRATSGWQASQTVRQRERRVQVQRALAVAGPVLTEAVASGGVLSEEERLEARIAEGRLRDELRGPRLLDDAVRDGIDAARRRGATVTVLDEGGLDDAPEAALELIRRELAETLSTSRSERVIIRTSPHESIAVTVVGRSADGGSEDVELWQEIAHPVLDA
ncbi:hypothetical protein CVS47_00727 [Microbacterium lemovicicum]|uniref:Uncharacterized protein n=1 Tax=Microbacterium lemovicicum TaxID=1072463 RepID=A0A3S9W7T2_9MICO|nr:hypothetical protein [Microbacterium lemovicicum]AZS36127.1 hypothetical protein CVS47_00727 [Microbacterium lemovicicum]